MKITQEHWKIAYKEYCRTHANPMAFEKWRSTISGKKMKAKRVRKSARDIKRPWIDIQREYLRWRKTEDFSKWKRKQFLKQGGTCYYCDNPIYGGVRENVEHVIPKSKGGGNNKGNLVLACAPCNKEKNTSLLSFQTKQDLKAKNKKKKGTYLKTREVYETEMDIALRLRDMF